MGVDVVPGINAVGMSHDADPEHYREDESKAECAKANQDSDEHGDGESDEHEPKSKCVVALEDVSKSRDDAECSGGPVFCFAVDGDIEGVPRVDHYSHLFSWGRDSPSPMPLV